MWMGCGKLCFVGKSKGIQVMEVKIFKIFGCVSLIGVGLGVVDFIMVCGV